MLPTQDPVTGDPLSRGEAASWLAQGIIRRWAFLAAFALVTLLVWTVADPIWHHGPTDVWNLSASFLAIVIEGVVGLSMYHQTHRDALILREIRAATDQIDRANERIEKLGELILDYEQRNER